MMGNNRVINVSQDTQSRRATRVRPDIGFGRKSIATPAGAPLQRSLNRSAVKRSIRKPKTERVLFSPPMALPGGQRQATHTDRRARR
jgi:hypothetical protein